MNNFNNDLYKNDFNFFSSKLKILIEKDIPEFLSSKNSSIQNALYNSLIRSTSEALTSEAKRIRPMICFWLFRKYYLRNNYEIKLNEFNSDDKLILNKVTNITLAIEILHCASLVIDDIEDGSKERRGQESLHVKYGVPNALNSGNWMYFLALKYIPQNLINSAIETLFDCHIGQALDLSNKNDINLTQQFDLDINERWELYQKCAELKTSRLIKFAFDSMNEILQIDTNEVITLENIFKNYGIIYQIFDDIKNLIPVMSKDKLYEDLNSGLRSSVVITFFELLSNEEKKQAFDNLKSMNFQNYFLSHQKKHIALEMSFQKAHKLLQINYALFDSINIDKLSIDYLSGIIIKPFKEIDKNILKMTKFGYNN